MLGLFEQYVNGKEIENRIGSERSSRITPMMFEFELIQRAKTNKMRIVLAEGNGRTHSARHRYSLRRDVAEIILLGDVEEIRAKASAFGLDIEKATLIDPVKSALFDDYANTYYELQKRRASPLNRRATP